MSYLSHNIQNTLSIEAFLIFIVQRVFTNFKVEGGKRINSHLSDKLDDYKKAYRLGSWSVKVKVSQGERVSKLKRRQTYCD